MPTFVLTIGGVDWTQYGIKTSGRIQEVIDNQPNTMSLLVTERPAPPLVAPTTVVLARGFSGTCVLFSTSAHLPTTVVNNFTIAVWVYASSASGTQTILNIGKEDTGYGFAIISGNWHGVLSGVVNLDTGIAVSTNAWIHLALKRNAGTTSVWVNGVQQGATSGSAPNAPTTTHTVGGLRNTGDTAYTNFFTGRIAQASVWEGVLADATILALGTGDAADLYPTDIVSHYPLGVSLPELDERFFTHELNES